MPLPTVHSTAAFDDPYVPQLFSVNMEDMEAYPIEHDFIRRPCTPTSGLEEPTPPSSHVATPQVRRRRGTMRSQRWIMQPQPRAPSNSNTPQHTPRVGSPQLQHHMQASPDRLPDAAPVVPLYMVCLDLAYAAAFDICTSALKYTDMEDTDSAMRFFMVFLPVAWLWDHANRFFNRFDQEDLVSELAVYCLMAGVMAIALNVRFCFYMDVFPTATDNDSTCIYLAAAYGACRALLTLLTAYVAIYVPLARSLLCQDFVVWIFLTPCLLLVSLSILSLVLMSHICCTTYYVVVRLDPAASISPNVHPPPAGSPAAFFDTFIQLSAPLRRSTMPSPTPTHSLSHPYPTSSPLITPH